MTTYLLEHKKGYHHLKLLRFALLFVFVSGMPQLSWGQTGYRYNELQMKNYEEMEALVNQQISQARQAVSQGDYTDDGHIDEYADREAVELLREGLKFVFSRPNQDNMVAKLVPLLRRELVQFNAFDSSVASILEEAIGAVPNKNLSVDTRATYLFVVENIMAESRPRIKDSQAVKNLFIRVKDSKLKVPNDVVLDRHLVSMFRSQSPAEVATTILRESFPDEFKERKPWWKFW